MALTKRDSELRLPKISYLEFKHVEMDRVLTALFARLAHNGFSSRLRRRIELTKEAFVDEFLEHPEWFHGFQEYREIVSRWVETHLIDMVNRGKPNQAVAAPRPLHGFTYRFRNPGHAREYGAAQHIYEMLYGARAGAGQKAIEHLNQFFFQGQDKVTGHINPEITLDVETQALLRLLDQVEDAPDTRAGRQSYPPLCIGSADLLAEDIQRILFYQRFIPRSVMVDYLKVLFAFHLALYHLRLFKLLPSLIRQKNANPICRSKACPMDPKNSENSHGDCPYRIGLAVDVVARPGTPMAILAERSTDIHYRRIPSFVKAYYSIRKLDEFANDLVRRGRLPGSGDGGFSVGEILQLLKPEHKSEREKFFGQRIYGLIQDVSGAQESELDPEISSVMQMELSDFDSYIEILVALRGRYHQQAITKCIDSLLLKSRSGALIAQPRTRNSKRRFVLDSRLLEVLLQIAMLRPGGKLGYHTDEMRIDELLSFLRERYGLHIDQLPGDGFGFPNINERQILRTNLQAFISRLREVGFYCDLSDAYLTQTVTPRYTISMDGVTSGIIEKGGDHE
jgi:hypothetical protein